MSFKMCRSHGGNDKQMMIHMFLRIYCPHVANDCFSVMFQIWHCVGKTIISYLFSESSLCFGHKNTTKRCDLNILFIASCCGFKERLLSNLTNVSAAKPQPSNTNKWWLFPWSFLFILHTANCFELFVQMHVVGETAGFIPQIFQLEEKCVVLSYLSF